MLSAAHNTSSEADVLRNSAEIRSPKGIDGFCFISPVATETCKNKLTGT